MDRMSVASGSIGSGTTLSAQTKDDFKPLYHHFLNIHKERDSNRPKAEKEAKTWIKCWKMTNLKSCELLINEVNTVTRGIHDKKQAKIKAGKHLWDKLNYLAVNEILPLGVSKSNLTNMTLDYVMKFASKKTAEVVEVVLDDDDDPPATRTGRIPAPPQTPDLPGSDPSLLNDMFDFFKEKFWQENIPEPNNTQLTEVVLKIVTDKVGFMPSSLLALFACDELHIRKDPRKTRAPRIEALFRLYFQSQSMVLPGPCPVEKLAKFLAEFCQRNRQFCSPVTAEHMEQYRKACEKLGEQQLQPSNPPPRAYLSPSPPPQRTALPQPVPSSYAQQERQGSAATFDRPSSSSSMTMASKHSRQGRPPSPPTFEFGLDPMTHKAKTHFLRKSGSYKGSGLRVFMSMKYIGESILDNQTLQYAFHAENDVTEDPIFMPVTPQEFSAEYLADLNYEKGGKKYNHKLSDSLYGTYNIDDVLTRFIDYASTHVRKHGKHGHKYDDAILVVYNHEHIVQLFNDVLSIRDREVQRKFMKTFGGFCVLEEEVRDLRNMTDSFRIPVDQGYEMICRRDPHSSNSESDFKIKERMEPMIREFPSLNIKSIDEEMVRQARAYFHSINEMENLRRHIQDDIERNNRDFRREGIFGIYPNLFYKGKYGKYERKHKSMASRFVETLAAIPEVDSKKGWTIKIMQDICRTKGTSRLFLDMKKSFEEAFSSKVYRPARELVEICASATVDYVQSADREVHQASTVKREFKRESSSEISISPEYSGTSSRSRVPDRKVSIDSRVPRSSGDIRRDERSRSRSKRSSSRDRDHRSSHKERDQRRSRSRDRDHRRSDGRRSRSGERDHRRSANQRSRSRDRRSESRRRSPPRRDSLPKGSYDSKELGFGNTRNLSQEDMKFFVHNQKEYKNVMDGIIAFTDIEKENTEVYNGMNSHKIVLDFLKYLKDRNIKLEDVKAKAKDKTQLQKFSSDIFGRGNKTSSPFHFFAELLDKAAYYFLNKYEPSEDAPAAVNNIDSDLTPEQGQKRLNYFLDLTYGSYIKKRKCGSEYFDLHEAIFFSTHIRRSPCLNIEMEIVANDFIKFLKDQEITPSELKKSRLKNYAQGNGLPASLRNLYQPILATIHELYIHADNATRFCAIVDAVEFDREEQNGLMNLIEFYGKCILQEIYLMIETKEMEKLTFMDINKAQLREILNNFSDQLINNGFTIFDAVASFYQGTMTQYMNNVLASDDLVDKELTMKLVHTWVASIVKRRTILGPPLALRVRDLVQKKAYILIRSYSIVDIDKSKEVQWNKSFPPAIEQEAVKIIHDKSKDIKLEPDQEMMQFLNLDDSAYFPELKVVEGHGEEPFIDHPGNVMLLESVKIAGKGRVQVRASLCGVPRIKPLAHMQIWANGSLDPDYDCKVTADDHRLICQNKLVLNLVNGGDTEVELPAFTLVAYAQVKDKNENTLRVKPLTPVWLLLFLKHYYETCKMDKIHDYEEENCFKFLHGHELKIRKSEKVNFRITFSEILKPETGELYNVHSVVFFLQNYRGDYRDYLEAALAQRAPIIACRDHENLYKYFTGVIPKCHQMRPRGKLSGMDFSEEDMKDVEMKKAGDFLSQLQAQHGVDVAELIEVIKEQGKINGNERAEFRLKNFVIMMNSMKYDLTQFVWDAMKAGKTRELFESIFGGEMAKYYKANPNMFQECQTLIGTDCLNYLHQIPEAKGDDKERKKNCPFKTLEHAKVSLAFLRLFASDDLNAAQNATRKELDRIIAKNTRESLTNKALEEELYKMNLAQSLIPIIEILKTTTEMTEAKHEKLSFYVAADGNALAYLLILPEDEDDTKGKIIHLGSRLLASCEKQLMRFIKLARCIEFAFDECRDLIAGASLTIFVDDPDVGSDHRKYVSGFQHIPKEFITISDRRNPAGLLLLSRPLTVDYIDQIERLYALNDTAKAYLSAMLTKKKKAKYYEKLQRLEQAASQEMEQGEDKDKKDKGTDVVTNKNNFSRKIITAWTSSKELVPYSSLIQFMTESFIVSGDNSTFAKYRANDLASRLSDADIAYDKLSSCNEDDLLAMLKKVRLPRDITEKQFSSVILDHFLPGLKQVDFESTIADDNDDENEQEMTLAEFFQSMEKGTTDANKKIVERKKLFVPMKKHFEACLKQFCSNNPGETASDMVNAWISTGRKVDELKSVYEKHIFKGHQFIVDKYEKWLENVQCPNILAQWTYDFFKNSKVYHAKTSLNHNDFRRKHLMKLQSETILRTSYAPLQHFYEILHKFHKKDEEAPQTAMKYIEVWMLLGFQYEDVVAIFMSAVHLPQCFEELLSKLRKIFEDASCFNLKDIDSRVLLEYTGMFFKAKALLGEIITTRPEDSQMEVDDEDPVDEGHWEEVKKNVLSILNQVTGEDFDKVVTEHLHGKYTAANLNKIMRKIPSMCDKQHFSAFKSAFQANLLKDKCDKPSHAILKDSLDFLSTANFTQDKMDEDIDEVEDGECITDTGNETDVSAMKIAGKTGNKKKGVLSLNSLTNLSHDDLKNGQFEETVQEVDFKSLRGQIHLLDNEFVWLAPKQRVSLQNQVQIGDESFKLERILCLSELPTMPYGDYIKEMRRNYPLVDPLKLREFEAVSSNILLGEVKVSLITLSKEQLLKSHLKKFTKMMKQKTEEPPTYKAVSISFQKLAQKFYKSVFANGLHCQQNWAEVSSSIAEECVDCWLVPNFSFTDLLTAFKTLAPPEMDNAESGNKCVQAKRKLIQGVYDTFIDGLIDHVDTLPPSLKLYYFTRDTMTYLESLVISQEL